MEKLLKVYIETSVWNFALETTRPESLLTYKFLKLVSSSNNYIPYVSDLVMGEINDAPEKRRRELLRLIEKYKPKILYTEQDSFSLADIYISEQLIPKRFKDDAVHIAIASTNQLNFLASWNFKHIVRAKTIHGVHIINLKEKYGLIEIVSPREFLGIL